MKTICLLLFLIISVSSSIQSSNSSNSSNHNITKSKVKVKFPFQRKIWTYWNSDKGQIPIIVKVCLDNLQYVAKKHNFTFVCLNESNVRDHIDNYDQEFTKVREKSIQKDIAHAADLLRMIVIEQNGGIWVDSTTIFLNGLTQLENIMSSEYSHLITNGFSPQPDALLFFYSMGQNRLQKRIINPQDSTKTILYNEIPNFQIWFIAAKKNCSIIRQIKKTYSYFTTTEMQVVQAKFMQEQIYMHRVDDSSNYLYLNMAVSYTLQRKQAELDKSLKLFGQRQSVFEYFKLWGLHSEYGPMIMTREDIIPIQFIFLYSKEQLQAKGYKFLFFMKQFGYFRYVAGQLFNANLQAFRNNQTFQAFVESNSAKELCGQLTFVVQGSIIHQLLKSSTVMQTHNIKIVTKDQNQQWQDYCSENSTWTVKAKKYFFSSIFHTLILRMFMYDKIHKAKVNQIISYGKDLSWDEWIWIKYEDNSFLIFEFGYILVVSSMLFLLYNILVKKFSKFIQKYTDPSFDSQASSQNMNDSEENKSRLRVYEQISSNKQMVQITKCILNWLIFLLFLVNCVMYNAVDVIGGRQQPQTILACIVFTYLVFSYIESIIYQPKNQHKYQQSKYMYEFCYLFINYMTTYLSLVHVRRNRFWLNWFSLVIGCVGPCLVKLHKSIVRGMHTDDDGREAGNDGMSVGDEEKRESVSLIIQTRIYRLIIVGLVGLITVCPNIQYLSGEEGYYIKWIPIIPAACLCLLYIYLLIKCIQTKLWQEIIRLSILLIVCMQLYTLTTHIESTIHIHRRMIYLFRTILILQAIYLQMGTSLKFKNITQSAFLNSSLNQFLVFFVPLIIQFTCGRFYWNFDYVNWNFSDYTQHLVIFAFNTFLVALFLSIHKINKYEQIQNSELTEIQHSQMH